MTDHELLFAMLGSRNGYHALTRIEDGVSRSDWIPVENRRGFLHHFELYPHDLEVGAVPCLDFESHLLHGDASVLWCRVETGESARRLARFMPRPTLVLRDGETLRRVALWALRKPLSAEDAERANRRIAHTLRTKKKWAAQSFRFTPPGITAGRHLVTTEERNDDLYGARIVVGHLPDGPDPEAWRQRAAAA